MIHVQLIILSLLFFVSCKENPYPEEGNITEIEPLGTVRPDVYSIVPEHFRMLFPEGRKSEYDIKFVVPSGEPVITFEGLPQKADYDKSSGKLIWHPDFQAANGNDPHIQSKTYDVLIKLSSSSDPITEIRRRISLEVTNTPRSFSLRRFSQIHRVIAEGKSMTLLLVVENEDFPQGPFKVEVEDFLPGVKITEEQDKKSFQVAYTPDHNVVKLNQRNGKIRCEKGNRCYKRFKPIFTVTAPDGRTKKQGGITIDVHDERLPFLYGMSSKIELDAPRGGTFYFSAYDQNLETRPWVSVAKRPRFGKFKAVSLSNEGSHYGSSLKIDWRELPLAEAGRTHTLLIKVCINRTTSMQAYCRNKELKVKITEYLSRAPSIDRAEWKAEEIKYLPFNTHKSFDVYFQIGNQTVSNVKILPEKISEMVSTSSPYKYRPGQVNIHAKTPGLHQFQLEVVSDTGDKRTENFVFEVFPQSRSESIYWGDSSQEPSLSYYRSLTGANYYSPLFLPNTTREMLYRNKIILAGEILNVLKNINVMRELMKLSGEILNAPTSPTVMPTSSVHNFLDDILSGEKHFKRIFIAAPNLENLPENFKERLESMGVFLEPRLQNVTGWHIIPTGLSRLKRPKKRVLLKGTFSSASLKPTPLKLSLAAGVCKPLIVLHKGRDEYYASVECPLEENRKLILSGFEWGDLKFSPEEQELSKIWYETLMTVDKE